MAATPREEAMRFNPRPREGATLVKLLHIVVDDVSIHAPVKGRRHGVLGPLQNFDVSIHAPVKGRPVF